MNDLLNLEYLHTVCAVLRSWAAGDADSFQVEPDRRREKSFSDYFSDPMTALAKWQEGEGLSAHYTALDAADKLQQAIAGIEEDAIHRDLKPWQVDELEKVWRDFQAHMGKEVNFQRNREKPLADRGKKFAEGSKQEKMDALSRLMLEEALSFKDRNGKLPTAKMLWAALPVSDCIQEKNGDDTDSWEIYWTARGADRKPVSFKAFQERWTTIRKKIQKNTPEKIRPFD